VKEALGALMEDQGLDQTLGKIKKTVERVIDSVDLGKTPN
jgi:hypothetical protein